jgi:hypothetical protein
MANPTVDPNSYIFGKRLQHGAMGRWKMKREGGDSEYYMNKPQYDPLAQSQTVTIWV